MLVELPGRSGFSNDLRRGRGRTLARRGSRRGLDGDSKSMSGPRGRGSRAKSGARRGGLVPVTRGKVMVRSMIARVLARVQTAPPREPAAEFAWLMS